MASFEKCASLTAIIKDDIILALYMHVQVCACLYSFSIEVEGKTQLTDLQCIRGTMFCALNPVKT